jgi:hypothetical protein
MLAELLQDQRLPEETRVEYSRKMAHELAMEFVHVIDPKAGDADVQAKLNEIHSQKPAGAPASGKRPLGSIDERPVYRC